MKVYIVILGYDYEGERIEGVFDSYAKAGTFLNEIMKDEDVEFREADSNRDDEWRCFNTYNGSRYESGRYFRIYVREVS